MTAEALLASWRDTPTRQAIVDFVENVTGEDHPAYVAAAERLAVFDNDGTLWSEKPIPIQLDFTLFRMAELADADASLREKQPYKAARQRDYGWLGDAMVKHYHGDDSGLAILMGAIETAFGGMTVDDFSAEVTSLVASVVPPGAPPAVPVVRLRAHDRAVALPRGQRVQRPTSPRVGTGTSCGRSRSSCTGSRPSG